MIFAILGPGNSRFVIPAGQYTKELTDNKPSTLPNIIGFAHLKDPHATSNRSEP